MSGPLPEGLVVDGEIVDTDLFARELKAFVKHNKLRGRGVQLAVSNQKVIVRNIDMPQMGEDELRGAIGFQAQDYIPIPVDEVVLDFQALGKRVGPDGAARQEVLLVAAQKTMIEAFVTAVKTGRDQGLGYRCLLPGARSRARSFHFLLAHRTRDRRLPGDRRYLLLGVHAGGRSGWSAQIHPHHQLLE